MPLTTTIRTTTPSQKKYTVDQSTNLAVGASCRGWIDVVRRELVSVRRQSRVCRGHVDNGGGAGAARVVAVLGQGVTVGDQAHHSGRGRQGRGGLHV